ncbi:hypothetical protein PQC31_gp78 [Pseudomonas phage Iggy]|uniref:Uncharacterized protein n=1 Tax=Pseudomonas phage Iggy TaxID=2592193 RepID=A0A7S5AYY7_9CAUD|nr:hypothetical protein PQC31_gp78 [Pseudomonas phage Iggy]QEA09799.1 hypothetical protein [Pseudomonas phage Iggy]
MQRNIHFRISGFVSRTKKPARWRAWLRVQGVPHCQAQDQAGYCKQTHANHG